MFTEEIERKEENKVNEKKLSNGVDCEYIYDRWIEVGNNKYSLTFNEDKTAFYTDDTKIDFYSYTVNTDYSVTLSNGEVRYLVRHWYKPKIDCSYLIFDGKLFTRTGKSIEEIQKEYDKKEQQKKLEEEKSFIIESVLGAQSKHSGGNIIVSVVLLLLGLYLTICISLYNTDIVNMVFCLLYSIGILTWGIIRCYHKYLFNRRRKLIPICNNAYGRLNKEMLVSYLRYCLKHGEVSIEEFINNSQKV